MYMLLTFGFITQQQLQLWVIFKNKKLIYLSFLSWKKSDGNLKTPKRIIASVINILNKELYRRRYDDVRTEKNVIQTNLYILPTASIPV